jgi:hypothetical protein
MITTKKLKPVRLDGRVYLDVQKLDRMPHISPMSVRSETRKCFVFIGWVVGFEPTATGTTITRVCTTHVQ